MNDTNIILQFSLSVFYNMNLMIVIESQTSISTVSDKIYEVRNYGISNTL